jgi:nitric oxide reductase subunit B
MPVYKWMWATGVVFFVLTYLESNLWLIPWFRNHIILDLSVQWKSNGAIVGSWNMLIYGIELYLMAKISGDDKIAKSNQAFYMYFLGLFNLLFNWGHHIYPVPSAPWIRGVSYAVSMTEWIILLNIIRQWKRSLSEARRHSNLLPYRFLLASRIWIFLNLFLALLMSIPVINLYTHGTHITVAHAMGTTIGINTMILLAGLFFIFRPAFASRASRWNFQVAFWLANISLFVFWMALIIAGIIKGVMMQDPEISFATISAAIQPFLVTFAFAGIGLATGLSGIIYIILARSVRKETPVSMDSPSAAIEMPA